VTVAEVRATARTGPPATTAPLPWVGAASGIFLAAIAIAVFTTGIQAPSPWTDEGATFTALWRNWRQLLVLLGGPDAPLVPYYVIAKGWVAMMHGVWPAVPTLTALRLLSAVAATATVIVLHTLVARNAGRVAGVLSGLFLVSIPGFNRFAQEARGYTLLALAATASWLAWDCWQNPRRNRSVATESRRGSGRHRRLLDGIVHAVPYTASLIAVAVVHTFGIFQWPAHLLATASRRGRDPGSRLRRFAALGGIMGVAAAVAGPQVVGSLSHGTGPVAADAYQRLSAFQLLDKVNQAVAYSAPPPASAVLLGLALAGAALGVKGRLAPFSRSLTIWLVTPLLLELAAASVRTNLFRIRYWIAFLPPLAALAGLGTAALVAVVVRVLQPRLDQVSGRAVAPWASRGAAAMLAVTLLGAQAALTLHAQSELRSPAGHGQNLTGILEVIARVREDNPGIRILIPSESGAGILACADPAFRSNPMRHFDPKSPTVFTRPTSRAKVRVDLAGERRLLWVYQAPLDTFPADQVPPNLAGLGLEVTSVTEADLGWRALMLERSATGT
jgi:hypothetical protein